jgi:hypothetical protein
MPDRLDIARRQLDLSYMDLWIDYFALGGTLDLAALTGYLRGDRTNTDSDHNIIVHALNELFQDRGQNHPVTYRAR